MGPGVAFGSGVAFSGVELARYVGHDLEVEQTSDGVVTLSGIY
jgi:hypothetical protein